MNSRFISTFYHPSPNPTRSQTYTVNFFNTQITTIVTSTPAVARNWVYDLRNNHHDSLYDSSLVVGLGVQWRPTFRRHTPPIASTLQLCVDSDCLIFQLSHANSVPATLRRLLEDDRVTFLGVHNDRDRTLLEESWAELEVWDVVDMAREEGFGNMSMEDICGDVLGFHGIVKPREIGLSNWDEFWLTNDQVQYACVDAHVAYLLGVEFGYPKDDYDDEEDYDDEDYTDCGDYDDDDYTFCFDGEYLDYEDYTNPYHYDSDWNYIG